MRALTVCSMIAVLNLASASTAFADNAAVNKAVAQCVDFVHSLKKSDNDFYSRFDAYYNAATGKIIANSVSGGYTSPITGNPDQEMWFRFSKCMAQKGFP